MWSKSQTFGLHYFKEKEEELEEDTYAIERSELILTLLWFVFLNIKSS